jgi:hypothetical protein
MDRFLDAAYRMLRAAYGVSFEAYKVVDLIWSAVIAVAKHVGVAVLGAGLAIFGEYATFTIVYTILFGPDDFARESNPGLISVFVHYFPLMAACVLFVAGQSIVVVIVTIALEMLLGFRLTFVLGTRNNVAEEGFYSPIGDGTTDAEDPLTF